MDVSESEFVYVFWCAKCHQRVELRGRKAMELSMEIEWAEHDNDAKMLADATTCRECSAVVISKEKSNEAVPSAEVDSGGSDTHLHS